MKEKRREWVEKIKERERKVLTQRKTEIYTINILSNVAKINHVQQNNKLGSKTRSLFLCSFVISHLC